MASVVLLETATAAVVVAQGTLVVEGTLDDSCAASGCWASLVDALPVLAAKCPVVAARAFNDLVREDSPRTRCMQEAETARAQLVEFGATEMPSWHEALAGAEAPQRVTDDECDTFDRGWQCHACSFRETFFQERVVFPACDNPRRALLLSQGGSGSAWLRAIPSEAVFSMRPSRFQVAMRRRLRWPLPLSGGACRSTCCRRDLDDKGDHAASCSTSGLLKLRSRPVEKIWVRILKEGNIRDGVEDAVQTADATSEQVVLGLAIAGGIVAFGCAGLLYWALCHRRKRNIIRLTYAQSCAQEADCLTQSIQPQRKPTGNSMRRHRSRTLPTAELQMGRVIEGTGTPHPLMYQLAEAERAMGLGPVEELNEEHI